jgi:electron transfer flavoprotein alpha subunit
MAAELGSLGTDVLLVPDAAPSHVTARLDALEAAIQTYQPEIVLAPATALGRDLVPRVAARLGLGLVGDAIGVELDAERKLHQLKPAFGGQVVAPILSRTTPAMATLRPGILEPSLPDLDRPPAEVLRLARMESATSTRVRCLTVTPEVSAEGAALEEARVIVCVGFGLGKDRLERAGELARRLGGVLAGTRKVCDLGWLPRQVQVGLSGRNVAPELYLALGVRGSFNHMVGLRAAGNVIAINRDPKAEIFFDADLGVVADAGSFLEAMLARRPA